MSLDAFTTILPEAQASTNGSTNGSTKASTNGNNGHGNVPEYKNPRGWADAVINGVLGVELDGPGRNATAWKLINRYRIPGITLSETEARAFIEATSAPELTLPRYLEPRVSITEEECRVVMRRFANKCDPSYDSVYLDKLEQQVARTYAADPVYDNTDNADNAAAEEAMTPGSGLDEFFDRLLGDGPGCVVSTCLPTLDDALGGGLYPGLTYLSGVSGGGKSTLGLHIGMHNARHGVPILYLALENYHLQYARWISAVTGTRPVQLVMQQLGKKASLSDLERKAYADLRARLRTQPLDLRKDIRSVSFLDRYLARRRGEVKLVIIDQLQHLNNERGLSAMYALEANSAGLLELSARYDIPIIGMSQINRPDGAGRGNEDWKPNRWSLRGSEQLYHDADNVLFAHRTGAGEISVNVNKGRIAGDSWDWLPFAFTGIYSQLREK